MNKVELSSVAQSCLTFCDLMNCITPGLPAHHQLLELTQIDVHWVGDTIQPSHPLSSPSPPAHKPSQHQSLFQWISSSHQVAKVSEFQLQYQSFQWIFRTDFLQDWLVWSSCSPRDAQEYSSTSQFIRIKSFDAFSPPNKFCHSFHCFPIYLPWSDGTKCQILVFWMFKPAFSLSSFTLIKRLFSSSS